MYTPYIEIKTTYDSIEDAIAMAKNLVDIHYVASAHTSTLYAFYRWKGNKCKTDEIELCCITRQELFDKVADYIRRFHTYECCQVIATPIVGVSKEFAEWIDEQTRVKEGA